jgi:hypothetical protein
MRRAIITILIALLLGTLTTLIVAAALFVNAREPTTSFDVVDVDFPGSDAAAGDMQRATTTGVTVWSRWLFYEGPADASPSEATSFTLRSWPTKEDISTGRALAAFFRTARVPPFSRDANWRSFPSGTVYLTDLGWPMPCLTGWFLRGHEASLANLAAAEGAILIETPKQASRTSRGWDWHSSFHAFPITPLWPGLAINIGVFATSWWVLLFGYSTVSRLTRHAKGLCPNCGYSREGLPIGAPCPECGRAASSNSTASTVASSSQSGTAE